MASLDFLDADKDGIVSQKDMADRLRAFYDELPDADEVRQLVSKRGLTAKDVLNLFEDGSGPALAGFDAVKESFRLYDPDGTGYVDEGLLRLFFKNLLGPGDPLTDDDLDTLVRIADVDGDGRISLEDYRAFVECNDFLDGSARERDDLEHEEMKAELERLRRCEEEAFEGKQRRKQSHKQRRL
jgi:calmodulin